MGTKRQHVSKDNKKETRLPSRRFLSDPTADVHFCICACMVLLSAVVVRDARAERGFDQGKGRGQPHAWDALLDLSCWCIGSCDRMDESVRSTIGGGLNVECM